VPSNIVTLPIVALPVSRAEAEKVFERDHFRCRYCGLYGKASFENALAMSLDFVVPPANKGKKDPVNLIACCRACNTIKGTRAFQNFEEAQKYVSARREELHRAWERQFVRSRHGPEEPEFGPELCAGL
jgi:5-methylcytosine-specific restriction endonuclease McrA